MIIGCRKGNTLVSTGWPLRGGFHILAGRRGQGRCRVWSTQLQFLWSRLGCSLNLSLFLDPRGFPQVSASSPFKAGIRGRKSSWLKYYCYILCVYFFIAELISLGLKANSTLTEVCLYFCCSHGIVHSSTRTFV